MSIDGQEIDLGRDVRGKGFAFPLAHNDTNEKTGLLWRRVHSITLN